VEERQRREHPVLVGQAEAGRHLRTQAQEVFMCLRAVFRDARGAGRVHERRDRRRVREDPRQRDGVSTLTVAETGQREHPTIPGAPCVVQIGDDKDGIESAEHLGQQVRRIGRVDKCHRRAGQQARYPGEQVARRAGRNDGHAGALADSAGTNRSRVPSRDSERVRQRHLVVDGPDHQAGTPLRALEEELGQIRSHSTHLFGASPITECKVKSRSVNFSL
jgi:hypothetical protein